MMNKSDEDSSLFFNRASGEKCYQHSGADGPD